MQQFSLFISVMFVALTLLTGNVFFMVGAFLFLVRSAQQTQLVREEITLNEEKVDEAMMVAFLSVSPGDSLRQASAALVKAPLQHHFPVIQSDAPVGLLSRDALMKGIANLGETIYVAEVMERNLATVERREILRDVLVRFPHLRRTPTLILEQGRLVGMLTADSVALYLTLRSLRCKKRRRR